MSDNRWVAVVVAGLAFAAAGRTWPAVAADGAPGERLCRLFPHALEKDVVIDTSDATSEIGAWVSSERARGWGTADVDFEVVQKGTGFPAGYVHVCLKR